MGDRWKYWLLPIYRRRAARISDPVGRLRYLSRSVGGLQSRAWQPPRVPFGRIAVAAVALSALSVVSFKNLTSVRAVDRPAPLRPVPSRPWRLEPLTANEQKIWLVENRQGQEVYSNGLRIETAAAAANEPRRDRTVRVGTVEVVAGQARPAGIVFHTTESHIAPFEASQNGSLQRVGKWLIDFLAKNKSYHYLIDRFGRVHRIVPEDQVAFHAGHSVWADAHKTYVELNNSFLAISLESETRRGDQISDSVTAAQVHALRTLAAMLRVKYGLEPENCITHAQVSVNPDNFKVGNHTDWASNFPFGEIGLPDNYQQPLPAMMQFGYIYDDDYRAATGARMWKTLEASDRLIEKEAQAKKTTVHQHRQAMRARYRDLIRAIPGTQEAGSSEQTNSN